MPRYTHRPNFISVLLFYADSKLWSMSSVPSHPGSSLPFPSLFAGKRQLLHHKPNEALSWKRLGQRPKTRYPMKGKKLVKNAQQTFVLQLKITLIINPIFIQETNQPASQKKTPPHAPSRSHHMDDVPIIYSPHPLYANPRLPPSLNPSTPSKSSHSPSPP